MRHMEFQPKLAKRELALVASQIWQSADSIAQGVPNGTPGDVLASRLFRMGTYANPVQAMLKTPIGGCIKTGVSAYIRQK